MSPIFSLIPLLVPPRAVSGHINSTQDLLLDSRLLVQLDVPPGMSQPSPKQIYHLPSKPMAPTTTYTQAVTALLATFQNLNILIQLRHYLLQKASPITLLH